MERERERERNGNVHFVFFEEREREREREKLNILERSNPWLKPDIFSFRIYDTVKNFENFKNSEKKINFLHFFVLDPSSFNFISLFNQPLKF